MARPPGRRTEYRKLTVFPSELAALLELCPEDPRPFRRVSKLCRDIALGRVRVYRRLGAKSEDPIELQEAREGRADGQVGRTPGIRTQRDILFFPAEVEAFESNLPGAGTFRQPSFQELTRGLASGRFRLEPDPERAAYLDSLEARGLCLLCECEMEDRGEYCPTCRGVEEAAA